MIDPSAPLGYPVTPQPPPAPQPNASTGGTQPTDPRGSVPPPLPGFPPPPPGYPPPPAPVSQPPPPYGAGPATGQPPPQQPRKKRPPQSDPGGLVAGLVIAGLGLFFLAVQLDPDIGRFVPLFIGLALLAVFVINRQYVFLVPGSLLTGVGIGIAVDSTASGDAEAGVMMLALAGGFLGIWVLGSIYRLPENHWWPLIPGGILTLIGLVQLTRTDVAGALTLWPVILIILGALLLGRVITRRD